MDIPNDETRRQLRDTQREHEATQPVFAAALDQAFDADADTPEAHKTALLGLSDRRGFLKIGGLTVATSALLVACVNPDKTKTQIAQTGTLPATTTTLKPANPGSAEVDATLVLTALSLEKLAIDTYQAALDAGWLTLPLVQDVAKYFQGQHRDHAELLSSTATKLGQDPSKVTANEYLNTQVVTPAVALIKAAPDPAAAQTATIELAISLEDAAAQTYTKAGGILTTTALRQAIMSIGAIEAKHYSVLSSVIGQPEVPFAFEHTTAAAPPDAYIKPNGPVTASTPGTTKAPGTTSTTAKAATGTTAK